MDHQQDGSSLMAGLLAHLQAQAAEYGISVPTPFKVGKSKLNDATNGAAAQQSPDEEHESEALNNNAVPPRDTAMATIMGCKIRQAMPPKKNGSTPYPNSIDDSPYCYSERYTSMARASLIDDLSDNSSSKPRFTPKKLIYSDSPCKESPSRNFSFDVEGCCNMMDAVGLETMPHTPYINIAPANKDSPAQMESSPAPQCATQDLQDLGNMLIQERAEKFALAAHNADLEEQVAALKKQLAER